jgi:hypothetical protein
MVTMPGMTTQIEERGSFQHGVCRACGWRGPGRRSRRVAENDLRTHQGECPAEELVGLP